VFSLDDGMRYWLFTEPTDMRKSFHMLSGIVNDRMSFDLRNGDVFIFINKNRNRINLLRKEPGGLVIYAMKLDYGRFHLARF
jgi:transposase